MPGAATGSSAVAPEKVCPLVTVSRLVPRRAISASSAAWEEAARPRTATIAATPIAMPSADSPARSLRVRSPMLARAARSPGRSRAAAGVAGRGDVVVMTVLPARARSGRPPPRRRRPRGRGRDGTGVGDDVPVEHLDAPPRPGGDRVVVGDDDDRRPLLVEFFQQGQDRGAGGRVQVPGRLVGQQHRRAAGDRPGDRDPLPLAPRQLGRPGAGPVPEPDDGQGVRGQPPPLGRGGSRRTAARRPRCPARSGARRGRTAGTRTRSGTPAAPPAPGPASGPRRSR